MPMDIILRCTTVLHNDTLYYMHDMYDVIINTKQGCKGGGGGAAFL